MHPLTLPLIGLSLAIGCFYLYQDIRKVKSWQQESSLPAPTPEEKKANLFGIVAEFLGLLVAKLLR
jgi:hypothetical protein